MDLSLALRLRHYQGQRLRAPDLQDEYDNLTWLRGLHVVALHDTWGIALGFDVHVDAGNVVVGPGLAYDCEGREILLTRPHALPGPQALFPTPEDGAEFELVMSYAPSPGPHLAEWDLTPCTDANGSPRSERPAFAWRRMGETRLGLEVPLVRVRITAGAIDPVALGYDVRRYTQPLARPHIAAGVTPAEQPWEEWRVGEAFLGHQTRVDTRAAGFVGTPFYFAGLRIERPGILFQRAAVDGPVLYFTAVAEAGPDGFTFRLHAAAAATLQQSLVRVSWLGVEPVSGCRPQLDLPAFLARFLFLVHTSVTAVRSLPLFTFRERET